MLLILAGCSTHESAPETYPVSSTGKTVVNVAKSMLGVRYRYGGRHPKTGFDCSGLVYYSHRAVGKTLPRTSQGQFMASQPVSKNNLTKGDLVFFKIRRNKISHVGIYLGDGRFIHAPSSGKKVSIEDMTNPYWKKRFIRGGRIF